MTGFFADLQQVHICIYFRIHIFRMHRSISNERFSKVQIDWSSVPFQVLRHWMHLTSQDMLTSLTTISESKSSVFLLSKYGFVFRRNCVSWPNVVSLITCNHLTALELVIWGAGFLTACELCYFVHLPMASLQPLIYLIQEYPFNRWTWTLFLTQ